MKIFHLTIFIFCYLFASSQHSEDVNIDIEKGKLFGTLNVADSTSTTPLVLIVAGSGPTDRNFSPGNTYQSLADSLSKYNISSLRFDKRTSGESVLSISDFDDFIFDDLVSDVKSWIEYLSKDDRFSEIIVLGHSQGSLLGILAAQQVHIDKFISLAGVGETADLVIKKQIYNPPINKFFFGVIVDSIFNELSAGNLVDSIPPMFASLFAKKMQPFLMSWMKYDPAVEMKKLNVPTLIVQGEMDVQVMMDQYDMQKVAMPQADTLLVKNMNHALKFAESLDKMSNIKNYEDGEIGILSALVTGLVWFIRK